MQRVNTKRLSLAFGIAFTLFYLGCVVIMAVLDKDFTIIFLNSLMHGIDTSLVINMEVPVWLTILSLVEMFVLGCLWGTIIGVIYNLGNWLQ